MKKLIHVVNPVKVNKTSDLCVAQPVTFRSMINAKNFVEGTIEVDLCTIGYPEDNSIVPAEFRHLGNLQQSVLDVGCFKKQRKLPLIKDILDSAVKDTDAEYVIYSNVDISLMPYFYEVVAEELRNHDALIINRRTIASSDTPDLPMSHFYRQLGKVHPGFDCFVFKRELYEDFFLGNACIGANWIGRVLICNLLAHAKSTRIIEDAHLTFHLGDERAWKVAENIDFDEHNEAIVGVLIREIGKQKLLNRHPLLQRTYDEFYLKSSDPDPSRPKKSSKDECGDKITADLSLLPTQYSPSSNWQGMSNLALRQDPVFIVGYPRSGTTLLQSLVATQYTPAIFPETHFFSIARTKLVVKNDLIETICLDNLVEFLEEKLVLSETLKQYISDMVSAAQLSPKMLFEAIVFDQLSRHIPAAEIPKLPWMEKTPDHIEHLEVIDRYYPEAKYIFIVRHPEKAILSRRKHFTWNDEINWPIEKHATKWLATIEYAEMFKREHPNRIIIARFEDIIGNKNLEMVKICQFLGTEYRPDLIDNYPEFSKQQNLPWESWKKETHKTIRSEGGYKNGRLSGTDCKKLTFLAKTKMEVLGYSCDEGSRRSFSLFNWLLSKE